jgi:hypothetical protein
MCKTSHTCNEEDYETDFTADEAIIDVERDFIFKQYIARKSTKCMCDTTVQAPPCISM